MGRIVYTDGTGVPHRGFEDEFLTHRKCSEWWFATGYLEDEEKICILFNSHLPKSKLRA